MNSLVTKTFVLASNSLNTIQNSILLINIIILLASKQTQLLVPFTDCILIGYYKVFLLYLFQKLREKRGFILIH